MTRPVGVSRVLHDAGVQWRRRNRWMQRDTAALLVAGGSVGVGALVVSSPLTVGLRQGIAFLLICVFSVALVVPLVRHLPLPVLRYGQSAILMIIGAFLIAFSEVPLNLIGGVVALLGLALLVAKVHLFRTTRQAAEPEERRR